MQCAKTYDKRLEGKHFLFVYRDRMDNLVKCFEVYFGKENYQHLTGLDLVDKKGTVLAVFSRTSSDNMYKKVCYVAKGLNLHKLIIPQEILEVVSLEEYIFKG